MKKKNKKNYGKREASQERERKKKWKKNYLQKTYCVKYWEGTDVRTILKSSGE